MFEILKTNKSFTPVLHQKSQNADIVFLGLPPLVPGLEEKAVSAINEMSGAESEGIRPK